MLLLAGVVAAIGQSLDWPFQAALVPWTAAGAALLFGIAALLMELFSPPAPVTQTHAVAGQMDAGPLDLQAAGLSGRSVSWRAMRFFLSLGATLLVMALIGLLPGLFLAMLLFARFEFRERSGSALGLAAGMTFALWLVFDRVFATPWPQAVIGDVWPWLRSVSGLI